MEFNLARRRGQEREEHDPEDTAPAVRLQKELLTRPALRASDIHIEPRSGAVQVRYRIDGASDARPLLPKAGAGKLGFPI